MGGNPNWARDARVYSTEKKNAEGEEEPKSERMYAYLKKGVLVGLGCGGGIEAVITIIPGIEEIPYCSEQDIAYRLAIGAMTAAILLPIKKEGEDVKNYWRKALYSGVGYILGTMLVYGGLEMITRTYEKL
jgi:hypothetical protein